MAQKMVRVTGLEPVRLSTRPSNVPVCQFQHTRKTTHTKNFNFNGGRWWIRTTEAKKQQIYSLPHLAALEISQI